MVNCPKCSTKMVLARSSNFSEDYWYCRTCKDELCNLQPKPSKPMFSSLDIAALVMSQCLKTHVSPRDIEINTVGGYYQILSVSHRESRVLSVDLFNRFSADPNEIAKYYSPNARHIHDLIKGIP